MNYLRMTLVISSVVLLAGCAVDQVEEVAEYRRVVDLAPTPGFVSGEPLDLRRALLLTNAKNERLSIEGENYLQAMIDRKRAVASFLPTLNLAPSYTRVDSTGVEGGNGEIVDVVAQADVDLFRGFSNVARLRGAEFTVEERRSLLLNVQESVLYDTVLVYYQAVRAIRSVEVLENSLRVQEQRVAEARARQKIGVIRPLDVAQVESQASATRLGLINARNDVQAARIGLALLTDAPVMQSSLVDGFVLPDEVPSLDELREAAAAGRHDLQAAEAAVRTARQQVDAAVGQWYPSVSLNLDYFLARDSFPTDSDWTSILRANLPIFSGGRIQADVREAWSRFRQTGLNASLARRQVAQDVAAAYQNVRSSDERLIELQTQLTASRQALEQSEASYAVGLATNLDRVSAQNQLLDAQLQLATEVYARKVYYLGLQQATGAMRYTLVAMPVAEPGPLAPLESEPSGPIRLHTVPPDVLESAAATRGELPGRSL